MILTAILIIFAFGILIFFHEFGHFFAAKILKIKVLQFSFGLGKEIFGKTINGTRYSLCVLPIGGAVKLKGENIEELDLQQDSFFGKKWYQRIFVVIMGPIMNYILAGLIFSFLLYFSGISEFTDKPIIGTVIENKPAYNAGIKPNDIVVSINNQQIKSWSEMAQIIRNSSEKKLIFEILRDSQKLIFEITPQKDPVLNYGIIGITPTYEIKKVGFLKSIFLGFIQPLDLSIYSIKYLFDKIKKLQTPEVAGPVGIVQVLSRSVKSGFENFLYTVATISTMLGLFNLFPIPILDGGHIFFAVFEGLITKKIPSKKVYEVANIIGLTIILSLFFFATYSDFIRIFYKK